MNKTLWLFVPQRRRQPHAANIIRASMGNISCKGNEEGRADGCDLIRVAEKLQNHEPVSLNVLMKISEALDVPIEKIVEFRRV